MMTDSFQAVLRQFPSWLQSAAGHDLGVVSYRVGMTESSGMRFRLGVDVVDEAARERVIEAFNEWVIQRGATSEPELQFNTFIRRFEEAERTLYFSRCIQQFETLVGAPSPIARDLSSMPRVSIGGSSDLD